MEPEREKEEENSWDGLFAWDPLWRLSIPAISFVVIVCRR